MARDIWHMTESHRIHSQELLLLALLLVLLATGILQSTRIDKLSLRQYSACVVDPLGMGITCLTSLHYVYKASQSCLSLLHVIYHYNILLGLLNIGLTKQSWFIYFTGAKPVHVHFFTVFCFFNQHLYQCTYTYMCILTACFYG